MNRSRIVVVLISGAGHKNFGDDAILSKWLNAYKGCDLIMVCGEAIAQRRDPSLIKQFQAHDLGPEAAEEIEDILSHYAYSIIHITGGGFCNDEFDSASKIFQFVQRLQSTATVIGTGVSFYPLINKSINELRKIKFKYISFRDRKSKYEFFGSLAPILGDDLLPYVSSAVSRSASKRALFINIQNQFCLKENLVSVANKIKYLISQNEYDNIVLCELCPGDLDIHEYLDGIQVMRRADVYAGKMQPKRGDHFICTRFHFRMLMEYAGASGVVIVANDYYANKHETEGRPVNFIKGRSVVIPLADFIQSPLAFPAWADKRNNRILLKKLEFKIIRLFIVCKKWLFCDNTATHLRVPLAEAEKFTSGDQVDAEARYELGRMLLERHTTDRGEPDDASRAEQHLSLALELGADGYWCRFFRAASRYHSGRFEDALVDLEAAAPLRPDRDDWISIHQAATIALANGYIEHGEPIKASAVLERTIVNPEISALKEKVSLATLSPIAPPADQID